jgi:nitroimidazol reductase NimA-like FMN-containing flavoprotein (pyridoxamine 5'-phosphate oxidase superfamily)
METEDRASGLSQQECLTLLAASDVGRVAFSYHALPAIVPVTFAVNDDEIVIRTSPGSRLAMAGEGSVVSFEVDEVEPALRSGWSVVVTGLAHEITDPQEQREWSRRIQPWAPGPRDFFLRIPMTIVTGRRILPEPASFTHAWVDQSQQG